jgi:probable HAF family extracellular repeat protein
MQRVNQLMKCLGWGLISSGAFGLVSPSAHAQTLTGLGFLSGGASSIAFAVSADGTVVVGRSEKFYPGGPLRAFRWTSDGGMYNLGLFPGADDTQAYACSGDGRVVVGAGTALDEQGYLGFERAFKWIAPFGNSDLGPTIEFSWAYATGVSRDGTVIVGTADSHGGFGPTSAFRWTAATGMVNIGTLPPGGLGNATVAEGVSGDGTVIVGTSNGQAYRWTQVSGMQPLGNPPNVQVTYSSATASSADGSVIVGSYHTTEGWRAFRWTSAGGMVGLGTAAGDSASTARAVSGDGNVIGGSGSTFATIWTPTGGMVRLESYLTSHGVDVAGWTELAAMGLSADGQTLVGAGMHLGLTEAWVARVPACAAEMDGVAGLSVQDIFAFIAMWFEAQPRADFNHVGGINVQDIFDYLTAWFAGC